VTSSLTANPTNQQLTNNKEPTMATSATPVLVKKGPLTSAIYAKTKSGNKYKLNGTKHLTYTPEQTTKLINKIKAAGKINIKHWTKF
tara:strand:+ start:12621 stop:12881 length:261 start_codon:yes stop_codon:yes gene_type:complete